MRNADWKSMIIFFKFSLQKLPGVSRTERMQE